MKIEKTTSLSSVGSSEPAGSTRELDAMSNGQGALNSGTLPSPRTKKAALDGRSLQPIEAWTGERGDLMQDKLLPPLPPAPFLMRYPSEGGGMYIVTQGWRSRAEAARDAAKTPSMHAPDGRDPAIQHLVSKAKEPLREDNLAWDLRVKIGMFRDSPKIIREHFETVGDVLTRAGTDPSARSSFIAGARGMLESLLKCGDSHDLAVDLNLLVGRVAAHSLAKGEAPLTEMLPADADTVRWIQAARDEWIDSARATSKGSIPGSMESQASPGNNSRSTMAPAKRPPSPVAEHYEFKRWQADIAHTLLRGDAMALSHHILAELPAVAAKLGKHPEEMGVYLRRLELALGSKRATRDLQAQFLKQIIHLKRQMSAETEALAGTTLLRIQQAARKATS